MSNKKTSSVVIILSALETLKVTMTSQDIRRLVVVVTNQSGNTSSAVQSLRTIVAQYRLDALSVLATKGIGMRTFETIQKLSKLLAAQDKKRDLSLQKDAEVVSTILRNMQAYLPDQLNKVHQDAKNAVHRLAMDLGNYEIERGLTNAVKAKGKTKTKK